MAPPKKAWKIQEKNPPSPRAYLAAVRRYADEREKIENEVFLKAKEDFEKLRSPLAPEELSVSEVQQFTNMYLTRLQEAQVRMPSPPTPEQIAQIGEPVAKRAVLDTERELRKAGATFKVLTRLIPIKSNTPFRLSFINLYEAGVGQEELAQWANEGFELIEKTAYNREWLEEAVLKAVQEGHHWEYIADQMAAPGTKMRARWELIARDQVAKLNSKITRSMHEKAGITSFIWKSANDQRVRKRHREVNGQEFTWAAGAPNVGFYGTNGWPGQAGQCRCTARPVPPDWWKNL